MVLVKIDIKNIASETHPDDKVVFRSPVVREAAGGGLVSTADEVVSLVDGVGELELVPGPVIVTFQCRGMADTRPKRGTVPDSGPVTVADVIGQNFTFTPEVVGAAQTARNQAVQAAADAEAAEGAAGGHAEDAGNSANAASGYAQEAEGFRDTASEHAQTATDQAGTATTKASEANASANTAANHASDADTARQGAVAAQGLAETARDEAETKVQTALAEALPTKADKEHEHTTAQVTGLDEALAGKAAQTTLDTRVPAGLALRVDTSVGTRIFAGDTMIYGDTGRRNIPLTQSWVVDTTAGRFTFRRTGELVEFEGRLRPQESLVGTPRSATADLVNPPLGYLPRNIGGGSGFVVGNAYSLTGGISVDGIVRFYNVTLTIHFKAAGSSWSANDTLLVHGVYLTDDPWPTSLPGLPA